MNDNTDTQKIAVVNAALSGKWYIVDRHGFIHHAMWHTDKNTAEEQAAKINSENADNTHAPFYAVQLRCDDETLIKPRFKAGDVVIAKGYAGSVVGRETIIEKVSIHYVTSSNVTYSEDCIELVDVNDPLRLEFEAIWDLDDEYWESDKESAWLGFKLARTANV